jgi:hypothetical protein
LSGSGCFARSYNQTPVGNSTVSTEDVDYCKPRCKVLLLESIKPFEKWEQSSGPRINPEDEEAKESQEGKESRLRQESQESEKGEEEVGPRHRSAGSAFLTKIIYETSRDGSGTPDPAINLGCCFPHLQSAAMSPA